MDKRQAAELLGISEHTLNRYVEKGAVSVQYVKGKGDVTVAQFNEEELRQFKERQAENAEFKPALYDGSQALTTRVDNALTETGSVLRVIAERLSAGPPARVPVESKLLLTLHECSQMTGLSRGYLTEQIKAKKLKARKLGRGWKVKRLWAWLQNFRRWQRVSIIMSRTFSASCIWVVSRFCSDAIYETASSI